MQFRYVLFFIIMAVPRASYSCFDDLHRRIVVESYHGFFVNDIGPDNYGKLFPEISKHLNSEKEWLFGDFNKIILSGDLSSEVVSTILKRVEFYRQLIKLDKEDLIVMNNFREFKAKKVTSTESFEEIGKLDYDDLVNLEERMIYFYAVKNSKTLSSDKREAIILKIGDYEIPKVVDESSSLRMSEHLNSIKGLRDFRFLFLKRHGELLLKGYNKGLNKKKNKLSKKTVDDFEKKTVKEIIELYKGDKDFVSGLYEFFFPDSPRDFQWFKKFSRNRYIGDHINQMKSSEIDDLYKKYSGNDELGTKYERVKIQGDKTWIDDSETDVAETYGIKRSNEGNSDQYLKRIYLAYEIEHRLKEEPDLGDDKNFLLFDTLYRGYKSELKEKGTVPGNMEYYQRAYYKKFDQKVDARLKREFQKLMLDNHDLDKLIEYFKGNDRDNRYNGLIGLREQFIRDKIERTLQNLGVRERLEILNMR